MAKIGSALFSRWVLSFVGTALLGGLVWVFGPFVPTLEGVLARALIILALLALWVGVNVWIGWRRRKREAALAKGVTAMIQRRLRLPKKRRRYAKGSAKRSRFCVRGADGVGISMSNRGTSSLVRRGQERQRRS